MRRKLKIMPFDMAFVVNGNIELCHATGYEICDGDPDNSASWWNEYEDSNGEIHYGR